jgi:hypothetical protein
MDTWILWKYDYQNRVVFDQTFVGDEEDALEWGRYHATAGWSIWNLTREMYDKAGKAGTPEATANIRFIY